MRRAQYDRVVRGKRLGVQVIGGTIWMGAMLGLEHLGVDPRRDAVQIRDDLERVYVKLGVETRTAAAGTDWESVLTGLSRVVGRPARPPARAGAHDDEAGRLVAPTPDGQEEVQTQLAGTIGGDDLDLQAMVAAQGRGLLGLLGREAAAHYKAPLVEADVERGAVEGERAS